MTKPTAVLFCPGRGSYGKDELGFVGRTLRPGPVADALQACDDWRRSQGRTPLSEIEKNAREGASPLPTASFPSIASAGEYSGNSRPSARLIIGSGTSSGLAIT